MHHKRNSGKKHSPTEAAGEPAPRTDHELPPAIGNMGANAGLRHGFLCKSQDLFNSVSEATTSVNRTASYSVFPYCLFQQSCHTTWSDRQTDTELTTHHREKFSSKKPTATSQN